MKNGFITEYLSGLVGEPLVYGTNDCHIMVLTVIEIGRASCRERV